MKIGFMGLGKMGKGLVLNLLEHKIEVVAFDRKAENVAEVAAAGAEKASSADEVLKILAESPAADSVKGAARVFWFMLTAGRALDEVVFESGLIDQFKKGDIIIDGANSNFNDSVRRDEICKAKGIYFLDAGVSGGPAGARGGASIMVGGDKEAFDFCETIFKALSVENGFGYMGPSGAGHFVKMVHNAIEYGMLQAIGEGYELLEKGPYKDLDLNKVTGVWQNGTVIRGFLIDLMKRALEKQARLESIKGHIDDTGEGKWAIETAMDYNVPFTANTYSLMFRYISRQDESFAAKVVAALRHEFGGHGVKEK
jgi:6-phosphogluconate dehydrogenase